MGPAHQASIQLKIRREHDKDFSYPWINTSDLAQLAWFEGLGAWKNSRDSGGKREGFSMPKNYSNLLVFLVSRIERGSY